MTNLGPNFYNKLVQMTSEVGMRPEDLLAIMVSESGINPAAGKGNNSAAGLIQFMPDTLHDVGFKGNSNQFRNLTGEEQLPFIKKYIEGAMAKNGGPFTSAAQYYVANFYPAALKLPGIKAGDPNTPIVEANPTKEGIYSKKYLDVGYRIPAASEAAAYKANPLFDKDKKGAITYGDMMRQVQDNKKNPMYQKALASIQNEAGYFPTNKPQQELAQNNHQSNINNQLNNILNKYMKMIAANDLIYLKQIYKSALPNNNILIQFNSDKYNIELGRQLSNAIDTELLATSYPYSDGEKVEIECRIAGPQKECLAAIKEVSKNTVDLFNKKLNTIGEEIKVDIFYRLNKKSNYLPISANILETNYRKLLLKFS